MATAFSRWHSCRCAGFGTATVHLVGFFVRMVQSFGNGWNAMRAKYIEIMKKLKFLEIRNFCGLIGVFCYSKCKIESKRSSRWPKMLTYKKAYAKPARMMISIHMLVIDSVLLRIIVRITGPLLSTGFGLFSHRIFLRFLFITHAFTELFTLNERRHLNVYNSLTRRELCVAPKCKVQGRLEHVLKAEEKPELCFYM